MSENHKYYYMKFKDTFFNDPKILLLEQMQDGPLYILLLLKFYLISLPYNGMLLIGENLPHTFQTLAIITRHQVGTVERAIKIFMKFGLIEILANHTYYMTDIQLFIGQSSTEAERKRM
ncbi:phage replisome organizer N-terminal domain-containing protein, partial [Gemmiger formicilis]